MYSRQGTARSTSTVQCTVHSTPYCTVCSCTVHSLCTRVFCTVIVNKSNKSFSRVHKFVSAGFVYGVCYSVLRERLMFSVYCNLQNIQNIEEKTM